MAMFIEPFCPEPVKAFFDFMREHITIQSNGMGVSIRETRSEISKLMEQFGWDYVIYRPLIDAFEEALLESHFKMREEPK